MQVDDGVPSCILMPIKLLVDGGCSSIASNYMIIPVDLWLTKAHTASSRGDIKQGDRIRRQT